MPPSDPWLVQSWRLQTEEVRIRRRNIHCAWLDEFAALAIAEVAERRSAQIRSILSAELKLRQALFIAELVEFRAIVLEQEIMQLESKKAAFITDMAKPEMAVKFSELERLQREVNAIDKQLAPAQVEWERLLEMAEREGLDV